MKEELQQHKLTLLELEHAIDTLWDTSKKQLYRILKTLLKETNDMSLLSNI